MIRSAFKTGVEKYGHPWKLEHLSNGGNYWAEIFARPAHSVKSFVLDEPDDEEASWVSVREMVHEKVFKGAAGWEPPLQKTFKAAKTLDQKEREDLAKAERSMPQRFPATKQSKQSKQAEQAKRTMEDML